MFLLETMDILLGQQREMQLLLSLEDQVTSRIG